MVGALLLRGMMVGVVAGILSFGFLKIVGEPPINRAIAFEAQHDVANAHAAAQSNGAAITEPELVSRTVQSGIGLLTGVVVYSAAFGGLFALAFALAYGRVGDFSPRATAALLAALGIVAVYIVPNLKYPASPPSVGEADKIGMRTALYFSMIALSLAAMILAGMLRARLQPRLGEWNAVLVASAAYWPPLPPWRWACPRSTRSPRNSLPPRCGNSGLRRWARN
jgi:Probable cobalt transporter subunit (CbtA)